MTQVTYVRECQVTYVREWEPTPELRFVEREMDVPIPGQVGLSQRRGVRILQQRWLPTRTANPGAYEDEWRDVPLVTE